MTILKKSYAPIQTKLSPPQYLTESMQRPRLLDLVNKIPDLKVLSVVAPPGYGKSTLLAQLREKLIEQYSDIQVPWFNIDYDDNDPVTMTEYLCAAFNQLDESIGQRSLHILKSGALRSLKELFLALIEDIYQSKKSFVLFIDDFHFLEKGESLDLLKWFVENLPEALTIIIASRKELTIPLKKLQLNGEYLPILANDLQFSSQEIKEFFHNFQNQKITDALLHQVEQSTEGWVGALQLLALNLKSSVNADDLIESFSGEHRDLMEYLSEAVFTDLPEKLKDFLLNVGLLDRFNVALSQYVLNGLSSQEMIEELESRNLFLIPLDNEKNWYRFHHLFQDFLRRQSSKFLGDETCKKKSVLASLWFEQAGYQHEAIHYALIGKDYVRSAELISQYAMQLSQNQGDHRTLLHWMKQLPEEYIAAFPIIRLSYAFSLTFTHNYEKAKAELEKLKLSISEETPLELKEMINSSIEMNECMLDCLENKIEKSRVSAEKWLEKWSNSSPSAQGLILCVRGVGHFFTSYFQQGYRDLIQSSEVLKVNQIYYAYTWPIGCQVGIHWTHGKLHQAIELSKKVKSEVCKYFGENFVMEKLLDVAISDIYYEKADFYHAYHLLKNKKIYIHSFSNTECNVIYYSVYARMNLLEYNFGQVEYYINEGEIWAQELGFSRFQQQLNLLKIELYLQTDRLNMAQSLIERLEWNKAEDCTEEIEDTNAMVENIFARLGMSRLLMSEGNYHEALNKLNSLINLLEKIGLMRHLLSAKIQELICYENIGQRSVALIKLNDVLLLASEEGFISVFLENGQVFNRQLYDLLNKLDFSKSKKDLVSLLKFRGDLLKHLDKYFLEGKETFAKEPNLLDSLSTRELEILSVLNSSMNNTEIAKSLHISLGTLKWHLHNIYQKLATKNRSGAVIKAKKLQLI